jgi:hypothetical protein
MVLLLLLPQSLEGTFPALSFPREETVQAERIVAGTVIAVRDRLAAVPSFDGELPLYLRARFPRPVAAFGSGLEVGDTRRIAFDSGGELFLVVAHREDGRVVFRSLSDTTPIGRWLQWEYAEVEWRALDAAHTHVSWTLHYERRLDPAWYFGPWERYGTSLAAGYLADTLTTSRD